MAEVEEKSKDYPDLSGGIQIKTNRFLQKDNEVNAAENATFDEVGGVGKSLGYTKEMNDLTSTTSTSTSTTTTTTSTSTSTSSSSSTSTSTSTT